MLKLDRISDAIDACKAIKDAAETLNVFHRGELSEEFMAQMISKTFDIKNPEARATLLASHLELWDV